jgi:uncharacterized protein
MSTIDMPPVWGRFEHLTEMECWGLMTAKAVGRVAFCTPEGPQVLPVNYVAADPLVVFRTAPGGTLARQLRDATAAFQVDEADEFLQSGWSVLIVGKATVDADPSELAPLLTRLPPPWPSDERQLPIQITAHRITGRRVYPT